MWTVRALIVIVLLITCSGCATMDPSTKRTLDAGSVLFDIGLGALALGSGDVVGAALWFGSSAAVAIGTIDRTSTRAGYSQGEPNVINEYIPPHKRVEQ